MPTPVRIDFVLSDPDSLVNLPGRIVLLADPGRPLSVVARKANRLTRGAVARAVESEAFARLKPGEGMELAFPAGMAAEALQILQVSADCDVATARKAGATAARGLGAAGLTFMAEGHRLAAEMALGLALKAYDFTPHKTAPAKPVGPAQFWVRNPERVAAAAAPGAALAEGVFFARDLVNEPANILTTDDFAARLASMQDLGLEVEILEEADMARLGMGALLGVGQGSESPSKLGVMQWRGGAEGQKPLALVGKGVVFDTGGISIKPAGGMEEMTMDMGGAATVAGVMRTLALRKARANVVGLVGLVENMPDGRAQRPGDVVRTMKGDTVEVINTDAEGRLVLADVLWYAQDRFKPAGVIDLATLTGAIIVALGHDFAGVFSNDDAFCRQFMVAAAAEGEGAWRMPLGDGFGARLKSRVADMMNVGGRDGGASVAAEFLHRFIQPDMPWIHLDIAGTALSKKDLPLSPKGATGWGVRALNRMIRDRYEKG